MDSRSSSGPLSEIKPGDLGLAALASALSAPVSEAELAFVQAVNDELAAEAHWGLVLVVRLPHHSEPENGLTPEMTVELHEAFSRRITGVLYEYPETSVRSDGADLLVYVPDAGAELDLTNAAEQLSPALNAPMSLDDQTAVFKPPLGIAVARPGSDLGERAATARTGLPDKVKIHWSNTRGTKNVIRPATLLGQAREAVASGRHTVRFQFIEDIDFSGAIGVRAVACWLGTANTPHPLSELSSLSDSTQLAPALFGLVLPEICETLRTWRAQRRAADPLMLLELPVSVVADQTFADSLAEHLHQVRVPARMLHLGIPCDVLASPQIDEQLFRLADTGVNLALTNYGTPSTPLCPPDRHPWSLAVIPRSAVPTSVFGRTLDEADRRTFSWLEKAAEHLDTRLLVEGVELAHARRLLPRGCLYMPSRDLKVAQEQLAGTAWKGPGHAELVRKQALADQRAASDSDPATVPRPRG
ncbi:EAL domain-containing protein [Amycolatopsis sp. cg13]|uniref:EAL domain-containing protein n=1 Tax=Amycolatopsis sp. cg13 TaxID=3238807 RepID=UPI003525B116